MKKLQLAFLWPAKEEKKKGLKAVYTHPAIFPAFHFLFSAFTPSLCCSLLIIITSFCHKHTGLSMESNSERTFNKQTEQKRRLQYRRINWSAISWMAGFLCLQQQRWLISPSNPNKPTCKPTHTAISITVAGVDCMWWVDAGP